MQLNINCKQYHKEFYLNNPMNPVDSMQCSCLDIKTSKLPPSYMSSNVTIPI